MLSDDDASRRSLRSLKAYAEQNPDAILVPSHDPDAWRALGAIATVSAAECVA